MVETIKGGGGLLPFDSALYAGLDSRAIARRAASVGIDSENIQYVPANPTPTQLQVLNCKLHGHPLGGTNVHIS
jgi:hypothetical protein